MTSVQYQGYTFADTDNTIQSISGNLFQSLIADSLTADQFTILLRCKSSSTEGFLVTDGDFLVTEGAYFVTEEPVELDDVTYGEPVTISENGVQKWKFYATDGAYTSRLSNGDFFYKLTCVSLVGLWCDMDTDGGLYASETTDNVIKGILGATLQSTDPDGTKHYRTASGHNYAIDSDVANTIQSGYLKPTTITNGSKNNTIRENIRDVLMCCGASILKLTDGSVHFTYNQPDNAISIDDDSIYMGDSFSTADKVTTVALVEHQFYADADTEDTLLYNTGGMVVSNVKVIFSNPCHTLSATDSQGNPMSQAELANFIVRSGVNFAVISGTGILYGKEYEHTKRTISMATGIEGTESTKTSAENCMVNSLNSQNLLKRMANYFGNKRDISASIVMSNSNVSTGSLIIFTDPMGEQQTGYVNEAGVGVTSIIKGDCNIVTGWSPRYVGNNYNAYIEISAEDLVAGKWNVPSSLQGKSVQMVLFGGGQGGQGGYKGADGSQGTWTPPGPNWLVPDHSTGYGGEGGNGGAGGESGKILKIDIASLGASYDMSFGIGGNGGSAQGGEGSLGTDSTIVIGGTTYTTSDGTNASNYINLIDGSVYAKDGDNGYKGGRGRQFASQEIPEDSYVGTYAPGSSATTIWTDSGNYTYVYFGGGGGGAAYGSNGGNAEQVAEGYSQLRATDAGNGANASASPKAVKACGGQGGNGGGGGGGRTYSAYFYNGDRRSSYQGLGGSGGNGSAGSQGADGLAIVYYSTEV